MGCIRSRLQHEVPYEIECSHRIQLRWVSGSDILKRMFRFGKSPSHLFPNLQELYNCQYYWGKLNESDINQAFHTKPFGSFLLRDATDLEKDNLNTKWMTCIFI